MYWMKSMKKRLFFGMMILVALWAQAGELHEAAKRGDLDAVKALASKDPYLKDLDSYGYTALHHAAESGCLALVEYLIDEGGFTRAWINAWSYYGGTALHRAARNGHLDIVKCLVAHGAEREALDGMWHTASELARSWDHQEVALFLEHASQPPSSSTQTASSSLDALGDPLNTSDDAPDTRVGRVFWNL